MQTHPFSSERLIGSIFEVEGSFASITLPEAKSLPSLHFGEYIGRGEMGEFLLIDVGGVGIFARVIQLGVQQSVTSRTPSSEFKQIPLGKIQLLSTLELSGKAQRGIAKYPRVGDAVYSASEEVIRAVLAFTSEKDSMNINLGKLTGGELADVSVPVSKLFGRHMAIVGATGSGKSWSLAHLAESVRDVGGRIILIDATGEFQTLGDKAEHLCFGSNDSEPDGKVVSLPHFMMSESDRNAFLNPASGSQLPKLREAVRSLRLGHAILSEGKTNALLTSEGQLVKAKKSRALYFETLQEYSSRIDIRDAPFDIKQLPWQIQNECVYPTDNSNSSIFGGENPQERNYVATLVSRINDLLQTPELVKIVDASPTVPSALSEIERWIMDPSSSILRISLRNLTFSNHLREIIVNIIGRRLLEWGREGLFREIPLVVAIDEAHQFFDVTVGDEFASTHLNSFDLIAKEGRKYGLTACLATQRPSDLPSGVLSQLGVLLVHRIADGRDRQKVEQAAAEIDQSATRLLPGLIPGEAIIMGVDFPVPVSVRIKAPMSRPLSDGPRYGTGWSRRN